MDERYNRLILLNVERKNYDNLVELLQNGQPYEITIRKVFDYAFENKIWRIMDILKKFKIPCYYIKPIFKYNEEDIIKLVSNYKILLTDTFLFLLFEFILFKTPNKDVVEKFLAHQNENFIDDYLRVRIISIEVLDLILYYVPEIILILNEDRLLNIFYSNVIMTKWNSKFDIVCKRLLSIFGYPFLDNFKMTMNSRAIDNLSKAIGPHLDFTSKYCR